MVSKIITVILILILAIIIAITVFFIIRKKSSEKYNIYRRGDYNQLCAPEKKSWKIEYLEKVYPLGTNLTEAQFDRIEAYYTLLLPESVQKAYSKRVFRVKVPGPSCQELPCDCPNNIPEVGFAPNPMLNKGWPPCNVRKNPECCESVAAYRKCFENGLVDWVANDTWDGVLENTTQPPPKLGQLWKPSLWNNYTLAVNKYDPADWNSFYNSRGDSNNSWVEVFHSSFSVDNITYGVWFYRAIGSGVFVNMGKTLAGLNKFHVVNLLGMSWLEFAKFILRPFNGDVLTDKIKIQDTGLGGSLDYWLNGQYHTNTDEFLKKYNIPKTAENLAKILEQATFGKDYNLNRMTNTGVLDHLIIVLANRRYNSIQFTVQSNLYTGFTTELMILGPGTLPYTDIDQIPKSQLRMLDPNNLPNGEPETDLGKPCEFDYPFACLYCKGLPATLIPKMACTKDVSSYVPCKKEPVPPPYGSVARALDSRGRTPNILPIN